MSRPSFLVLVSRLTSALIVIGLDIQDDMGRHEVGHLENTERIEMSGGTGCRFEGNFKINRVPGNFHVSTHSASRQPDVIDMTHVIHSLTFGDDVSDLSLKGGFNSLAGTDKSMAQGEYLQYNTLHHLCVTYLRTYGVSGRVSRVPHEDRTDTIRGPEWKRSNLLPVHGGSQDLRVHESHGTRDPRHLVPV